MDGKNSSGFVFHPPQAKNAKKRIGAVKIYGIDIIFFYKFY